MAKEAGLRHIRRGIASPFAVLLRQAAADGAARISLDPVDPARRPSERSSFATASADPARAGNALITEATAR